MLDFNLTPEIEEIRQVARDFARRELRPAEVEIDRIADPEEAFRSEPFARIRERLYEMGFHKLTIPEDQGGLGLPQFASFVVLEELAVGGAGLASHHLVAPIPAYMMNALLLADRHPLYKEYLQKFVEDTKGVHSGAWAITEPEVGSDIFTFDHNAHMRTKATVAAREGNGYRIDGAKSAFVSNGYLADFLLLMAGVDPDVGMSGTGVFLIPGDLEGITRGRPLDKLGLRALNQSEIFFDDVWVPEEMLIVPAGDFYKPVLEMIVTAGNTSVGILALGVARAAYEAALEHAKDRKQGGQRIFDHQLVMMKLFDAYRQIEAARLYLWKSAWLLSNGQGDLLTAMAARTVASEMAVKVTCEMVQIFGGYGISREYPVEKYYRDAKLLSIMDGTNERVAMAAAPTLAT